MKKILIAFCMTLFLARWGDDSSAAGANGRETQKEMSSSSSEERNNNAISSSSRKNSSSSAKQSPEELLGPWNNPVVSSSSVEESSCEGCIDWSIPKEAYLNPGIEYDSITDERDGKVYKTVKIGEQVWMAENLNYSDSVKTPSLLGKSWCNGNDPKKCEVAGRLYTWAAAIDSVALSAEGLDCGLHKVCELPEKVQGICPQGWRLPSLEDWLAMLSEIGGDSYAGTRLKSQLWDGDEVNPNFDRFGFSAIPAGAFHKTRMFGDTERDNSGEFYGPDERVAFFWFASEETKLYAYFLHIFYNTYTLFHSGDKDNAYSIRCIKDY